MSKIMWTDPPRQFNGFIGLYIGLLVKFWANWIHFFIARKTFRPAQDFFFLNVAQIIISWGAIQTIVQTAFQINENFTTIHG